MTSNDCNHWANLSDRLALEEKLTFEERSFVSAHGKSCVACAAEAELFDAMRSCLTEDSSTLLVRAGPAERRPSSSRWRFGVGIAGLAAAAALLFVLVGTYDDSASGTGADRSVATPAAVPLASGPASTLDNESAIELLMVAGEVAVSGADRSAGTSVKQGAVIETKQGRVCLSQGRSATLCLESSSELEVLTAGAHPSDANGQGTAREQGVALIKGTLACKQESESKAPFLVQTKWGTIRGWGATFVVGYLDSGEAFLRLHKGRIQVGQKGGRSSDAEGRHAFQIGETWSKVPLEEELFKDDAKVLNGMSVGASAGLSPVEIQSEPASSQVTWDGQVIGTTPVSMMATPGEHQLEISLDGYVKVERTFTVEGPERASQTFVLAPEQTSPQEGPRSLLQRAQALRGKGEYVAASAAYEHLIRSYPSSGEGRAALVSLGELSLSQLGAPQKALSSFERYLNAGGPLSQEASYGQIRALRTLGREDEARVLGRKFVSRYPDSAQAVSLRQWL